MNNNQLYLDLLKACKNGNLEKLEYFYNLNSSFIFGSEDKYKNEYNPLFQSIYYDNFTLVEYLLSKGVDSNKPSYVSYTFMTPLNFLLSLKDIRAGNEETADIINKKLNNQIMHSLIKFGADVNKENEYGYTPLDLSILYEHIPVIDYLILNEAKFSKKFVSNNRNISKISKIFKEVNILEKIGIIETKFIEEDYEPVLHSVIRVDMNYHIDFAHKLTTDLLKEHINEDLNPNEKDSKNRTSLDYAIELGHTEAVKFLREHGAKTSEELQLEDKK
jgi:ankyrin repeat protein